MHKIGNVGNTDRWILRSENIAYKLCDKTVREYKYCNISKDIRWFFDCDKLRVSESITIDLTYADEKYSVTIECVANGSADATRFKISTDLYEKFKIGNENCYLKFSKKIENSNTSYFVEIVDDKEVSLFEKFVDKLRKVPEMDPYKHDGCYKLVKEVVDSYSTMPDLSVADYHDLDLLYHSCCGTWKGGFEKKEQLIETSNLNNEEKQKLKDTLDTVKRDAENNKYENHEEIGTNIGLFTPAFHTFTTHVRGNTTISDINAYSSKFIKMCIDIKDLEDENEIFDICEPVLKEHMPGMGYGIVSQILHCIKPNCFPILNTNQGNKIYSYFNVVDTKNKKLNNYIPDSRVIKDFRDTNFDFKNYRILDLAARETGAGTMGKSKTTIDYKAILNFLDKYAYEKYRAKKNAVTSNDEKKYNEISEKGKNASDLMKKILSVCENKYNDFSDPKPSVRWLSRNGIDIKNYLWLQLKCEKYKDSSISISVFAEKSDKKGKTRFRVSLEIDEKNATEKDVNEYYRYLDIVKPTDGFVYVAGATGEPLVDINEQVSDLKNKLSSGTYKKVQLCKIIEKDKSLKNEDYEKFILDAVGSLIPYYNYVLSTHNLSSTLETKNIILFGPPGTGKTYDTARYAVELCSGNSLENIENKNFKGSDNYSALMEEYKKFKDEGRIEFTTFHQSYGYEDFIEGIKPVMDSEDEETGEIAYSVLPGLFKSFCDRAGQPVLSNNSIGLNSNPTIWKVSLECTGKNPTRTECLANGHIRIGYDEYGENITSETDFSKYKGERVLNTFICKMQVGDIVLSCYSSKEIDAIGVVTGEYEWHDEYPHFKRLRKVKWLVKDIKEDIVQANGSTMTLSSVYSMKISLDDVMSIVKKYSKKFDGVQNNTGNYVFIIDEINRGNISKIFGELITLIEESKRRGCVECVPVTLPYSGKPFSVPNNVYIIGTMNTADRSIANLDTALRRRFTFVEMMPRPDELENKKVDGINLHDLLQIMNDRIIALFDREHTIGHAYFMNVTNMDKLAEVMRNKIMPLLQEYFFDDYERIRLVLGDNQKSKVNGLEFVEKVEDKKYSDLFGNGKAFEINPQYKINSDAFKNKDAYEFLQYKQKKNENESEEENQVD